MGQKLSLPKLLAAVSIVGLLIFGFTFSINKAVNEYVNIFVLEILDFLALYSINLSVEQFWIVLAIGFLVGIVIFIANSD